MGFGSAATAARVGRLAAIAQCLPTARAHLSQILPDTPEHVLLEAVPLAGVDDTLSWLRDEYGIELAATGDIATGQEPRFNPHQPFQPVLGLQGLLLRAIAEKQRPISLELYADAERTQRGLARAARRRDPACALVARQRAAAHLRHQVRLRAAAGQGVGGWRGRQRRVQLEFLNPS